jgi:hypothetical protein
MKINRLHELKQKLTNESDLSKIWLFYMDHFADKPEFLDVGERAENKYLDTVIRRTCQQMFGKETKITDSLLIHIAKYRLFHGAFQVKKRTGGVIFFEDIKVGLLAVSADYPPTDMVKYSRFSEMRPMSAPQDYNLN